MSLTIQPEANNDNILAKIETMQKCVKALLQTKHYQVMGEAGIFAILQKAESLGMPQMEALNGGLYVVNGKVGMSTEAMASMIRSKGHSVTKDPKSNNSICILNGRRADNGDTWSCSFSLEDAKRAGLMKNLFEKYPGIMIYNRCMSMLARQLFPDVIKGAGYTLDELKEIADSRGSHVPYTAAPILETAEVIIPRVSQEQADELMELLEYCEEDYKASVMKVIQAAPYNAQSLYEFPLALYDRCIKTSRLKKEEYMSKQQQQAQSSEQLELAIDNNQQP